MEYDRAVCRIGRTFSRPVLQPGEYQLNRKRVCATAPEEQFRSLHFQARVLSINGKNTHINMPLFCTANSASQDTHTPPRLSENPRPARNNRFFACLSSSEARKKLRMQYHHATRVPLIYFYFLSPPAIGGGGKLKLTALPWIFIQILVSI